MSEEMKGNTAREIFYNIIMVSYQKAKYVLYLLCASSSFIHIVINVQREITQLKRTQLLQ